MGRFGRIFPRLLLFNVLLVFLPVAGLLYLDTYEQQILQSQERSMVQQGRVLAAALGGQGPLEEESSLALLARLEQRVDARLRIVDSEGGLLADSSRLGPKREPGDAPALDDLRGGWLYRAGARATLFVQRLFLGPPPELASSDVYDGVSTLVGREIQAALGGRYGAATRITSGGQRSVTLYSAIPVRDGEEVVGAVLVSQSTARILGGLVDIRLDIFRTVLASIAVAIVLSLVFSATIARPLSKLRRQAGEIVDRRGRLRSRFDGSSRNDEIGDLARALEVLSVQVESHQAKLESFASDVAHELKNPLASIRTATEVAGEVEDPDERLKFLRMVERDVARMEHVLSEVRELATLDASRNQPVAPVDVAAVTRAVVDGYALRQDVGPRIVLTFSEGPIDLEIDPEHYARILTNLLDNALSFAPPGTDIGVDLRSTTHDVELGVVDRGPGIAEDLREQVFDRFYSARPEAHRGDGHLGLGLAIVRAVVESYRGQVVCKPGEPQGAHLLVILPRSRPGRGPVPGA